MKLRYLACIFTGLFLLNHSLAQDTCHLKTVLLNAELRQQFNGFLDEVLRQADSSDFFKFVDRLSGLSLMSTDAQVYSMLLNKIDEIKPTFQLYAQLKSLRHQQGILARQIQLLVPQKTVNGYVEIGTPGIYFSALRKKLHITSAVYSLCDTANARMQQLFGITSVREFFKQNTLLPLDNYNTKSLAMIPDGSIELVVCTIGLHHIPTEKVVPYVQEIKRILKPGGAFILREHDVRTPEMGALTHAAHSVYNALMLQLPVEQESAELRNFQPLSYWVELLTAQGLSVDSHRLVQQNDPTWNTLSKFVKPLSAQETLLENVKRSVAERPEYERPEIQTYLSSPEWFNVDVSQEYGSFINHTPFYHFPYIASVKSYWKIFANSWRVAAQRKGHWEVLSSPSTLMNLFVGVTMTLEYGAKSLISAPVRWLYNGQEAQTLKVLLKDVDNQVESIDERIQVLSTFAHGIKLVEVPRYQSFLAIMQKMAASSIELIEIAGQKQIQFKVRQAKGVSFPAQALAYVTKEYEWELPTQPQYHYFVLSVPVECIKETIVTLAHYAIELLYIHDF